MKHYYVGIYAISDDDPTLGLSDSVLRTHVCESKSIIKMSDSMVDTYTHWPCPADDDKKGPDLGYAPQPLPIPIFCCCGAGTGFLIDESEIVL